MVRRGRNGAHEAAEGAAWLPAAELPKSQRAPRQDPELRALIADALATGEPRARRVEGPDGARAARLLGRKLRYAAERAGALLQARYSAPDEHGAVTITIKVTPKGEGQQ